MIVYVGFYVVLVILAMIEMLSQSKKVSFLTASLMAFFAGFRFYTGFDFISYGNFYKNLNGLQDVFNGSIDAERGYLFLSFLFKSMGLNYPTFILFFSFFSIGLLFYYLYRNVPYPSIILLYYFARFYLPRDMGQIRGSIASIILLYAIPYIEKRDFIKFFLIVLAASLFHISSLIFLIGYIFVVYMQEYSRKKSGLFLLIGLLIGIVANIPRLYIWLIPGRYMAYFTSPEYTNGSWLKNPVLWMQLLIFFAALYFTSIKDTPQYKTYFSLYLLSSFILIAGGNLATIGGRMSAPFTTQEIFVAPYLLLNFTRNKLLNVMVFLGFSAIIFLLIFVISGIYVDFIPYQTIFG